MIEKLILVTESRSKYMQRGKKLGTGEKEKEHNNVATEVRLSFSGRVHAFIKKMFV